MNFSAGAFESRGLRALRILAVGAACALAVGCHSRSAAKPRPPAGPDAPYELADSDDLAALRDRFEGTPRSERRKLRDALAAEYRQRAEAALDGSDHNRAYDAFTKLVSLFDHPAELASPPTSLRAAASLAQRIRTAYAARGGDHQAALALYVLAAVDNSTAPKHFDEIETIFTYSDELAVAEHGEGAQRSRSLEILQAVVAVAPFPEATKRLIELYRERHSAIDDIIRQGNLSYEIIGAHGESVLHTTWHIIRVSALARSLESAPTALEGIDGFGDDPELRLALTRLRTGGAAEAIGLARRYDGSQEEKRDLDAALAILEWALEHWPKDRALLRAAGMTASKNNHLALGIRLLEAGVANPPRDRKAAAELAELYEFRVTTLSLTGRPHAANKVLAQFERFYGGAAKVWSDFKPDLANAYAAMGRGLLSMGDLRGAKALLSRSVGARATLEALEHLGTLALRRDQFELAADHFGRALRLPAKEPSVRFNRAKLMRLAGESLLGAGRRDPAYGMFLRALEEWRALRSSKHTSSDRRSPQRHWSKAASFCGTSARKMSRSLRSLRPWTSRPVTPTRTRPSSRF